ncbi:cyanophycinase-like [Haliotis asinina]|uniref:cyanophycinase-like n=1 Tax=Haliotis asinina TaxID=109174 RepID=UPI003531DCFB
MSTVFTMFLPIPVNTVVSNTTSCVHTPGHRQRLQSSWPSTTMQLLLSFTALFVLVNSRLPQYTKYGKNLVFGGGALMDNNADVWSKIVEMAGGKGKARIGVISAASATPTTSAQYYVDLLVNNYTALEATFIPVTVDDVAKNSDPNVVKLIKQQTGFFISGGDQMRLVQAYVLAGNIPSPALQAIKDQYDLGAVISGSSAGTTVLTSGPMVTGGRSWDALRYGAHESSTHANDLTYWKTGGFGIYPDYLLDTHFSNRGREGRMMRLLSDTRHMSNGVDYGLGVSENTALVVTHVGTDNELGEVFGELGVTIVDISKSFSDPAERYYSLRNVFVSYLTDGDTINMKTRNITFSPSKTPLRGNEGYDHALTSNDIFYGEGSHHRKTEFLRVAASLFDARKDTMTYGDTHLTHPQFRVTMSKTGTDTEGYVERHEDFHSDTHSYKNMYVEIGER